MSMESKRELFVVVISTKLGPVHVVGKRADRQRSAPAANGRAHDSRPPLGRQRNNAHSPPLGWFAKLVGVQILAIDRLDYTCNTTSVVLT